MLGIQLMIVGLVLGNLACPNETLEQPEFGSPPLVQIRKFGEPCQANEDCPTHAPFCVPGRTSERFCSEGAAFQPCVSDADCSKEIAPFCVPRRFRDEKRIYHDVYSCQDGLAFAPCRTDANCQSGRCDNDPDLDSRTCIGDEIGHGRPCRDQCLEIAPYCSGSESGQCFDGRNWATCESNSACSPYAPICDVRSCRLAKLGEACTIDAGCSPEARFCHNGVCTKGILYEPCFWQGDCTPGMKCENNTCLWPRCGIRTDCPSTARYCVNGTCSPEQGKRGDTCLNRSDCKHEFSEEYFGGPFCVDGKCTRGVYGDRCDGGKDCVNQDRHPLFQCIEFTGEKATCTTFCFTSDICPREAPRCIKGPDNNNSFCHK